MSASYIGSPLSHTDVLIEIDTASLVAAGKMQADCDDLRVTDSDMVTPLDYWIEGGCNTSSTQVWARVPSMPDGGTITHTHEVIITTGGPSTTGGSKAIGQTIASASHTDSCATTTDQVSNIPPYMEVIFTQRNDPAVNTSLGSQVSQEEYEANPVTYLYTYDGDDQMVIETTGTITTVYIGNYSGGGIWITLLQRSLVRQLFRAAPRCTQVPNLAQRLTIYQIDHEIQQIIWQFSEVETWRLPCLVHWLAGSVDDLLREITESKL